MSSEIVSVVIDRSSDSLPTLKLPMIAWCAGGPTLGGARTIQASAPITLFGRTQQSLKVLSRTTSVFPGFARQAEVNVACHVRGPGFAPVSKTPCV